MGWIEVTCHNPCILLYRTFNLSVLPQPFSQLHVALLSCATGTGDGAAKSMNYGARLDERKRRIGGATLILWEEA